MSPTVLPQVRLIFACDAAWRDPRTGQWVLNHPWSVRLLPAGASFPFRLPECWVYAQFSEGVGAFDLAVAMSLVHVNGARTVLGWSNTRVQAIFPGGRQLLTVDTAFHLTRLPFRQEGLYEFRVVADGQPLAGRTAEVRVLDRRTTL
jgi:hypothetical protein